MENWIGDYIGIPFDELNCWQLMCKIYEEQFNVILPDYQTEYRTFKDRKNIKKIYNRELAERAKLLDEPMMYCFIVLRILGLPWHVGLVVSKNQMLHTNHKTGSCVEEFTSKLWVNRIIGFYLYA